MRYLEWTWDPDPGDASIRTDYAFLVRGADGFVRVVHEAHRTGLLARDVWIAALTGAGFAPELVTEETTEDRAPRDVFVGRLAAV